MLTEVGGGGWMSSSTHTSELRILLAPHEQRTRSTFDIVNAIRPKLMIQPGMIVRARSSSSNFAQRMGPSGP